MSKLEQDDCFQLKADFFPFTVLKIAKYNLNEIEKQLNQTIEKAPKYLNNAPIVIDLDDAKRPSEGFDIENLCNTLREQKIIPVGVRGLEKSEEEYAITHGLAVIKSNRVENLAEGKVTPKTASAETIATAPTKIITKPVRAGTQVYAKGGDLLVLAAVNAGAECIADGNIHVYGPLRGRALAGANGNKNARIFCEDLQAELIAIAGHYLIKDKLKAPKTKKPLLQIFLNGDNLIIEGI